MKWVEVIEFRSFNKDEALLELDFWNCLSAAIGEVDIVKIEVYNHSTLTTDISIHLHYDSAQVESEGSSFGMQLVSELKAFGVVNHTVWVEKFATKTLQRIGKWNE
jgi:hypothetical protein